MPLTQSDIIQNNPYQVHKEIKKKLTVYTVIIVMENQ